MTIRVFTKLGDKRNQQSPKIVLVRFVRVEIIACDNFRLVSGAIDLIDDIRAIHNMRFQRTERSGNCIPKYSLSRPGCDEDVINNREGAAG